MWTHSRNDVDADKRTTVCSTQPKINRIFDPVKEADYSNFPALVYDKAANKLKLISLNVQPIVQIRNLPTFCVQRKGSTERVSY